MGEVKIKRPVGKKPDPRFKEVDVPLNKEDNSSNEEVIPRGELFELKTSVKVREVNKAEVARLIHDLREGARGNHPLLEKLIRKIEIVEIDE